MGPYLTVPNKTKEVQDAKDAKVSFFHPPSSTSELAACRDGGTPWKTPTSPASTSKMESNFLVCTMDTVVRLFFPLTYFLLGNEVAEWVRDHLIDLLKNLPSFQEGNYE